MNTIDAYLQPNCPLGKNKEDPLCQKCTWLDKINRKCIFAVKYHGQVTIKELIDRMLAVNGLEQKNNRLEQPRFVVGDMYAAFKKFRENCKHLKYDCCVYHESSVGDCEYELCPLIEKVAQVVVA